MPHFAKKLKNSVGLVSPKRFYYNREFELSSKQLLPNYELIYETYGKLNAAKTNAVLVCHALSGNHHAAGYHNLDDKNPGWWESAIGPGKAIDTNKFYVVSLNNLGGCSGSTGPVSINPNSGKLYGSDFPMVTVLDWVRTQRDLMQYLKIKSWCAVIGGSLGGMQVLQWTISYPKLVKNAVVIAAAPNLSAQNIGFNEVARQAIISDPAFCNGHYLTKQAQPAQGLRLARMLGHITYLSNAAMGEKFGRRLQRDAINFDYEAEFQVESYLRHQGNKFAGSFDANSYLLMTKALDYFDPAKAHDGDLAATLAVCKARFLIISFTTDWRFPPQRSKELVQALVHNNKQVSYAEIDTPNGHDAFLLDIKRYMQIFKTYLQQIKC